MLPRQTVEREKVSLRIVERYLQSIGTADEFGLWVVARTANTVTLDWPAGGVLDMAPTPSGPWQSTGLTRIFHGRKCDANQVAIRMKNPGSI
jgi:hypothetical protein